jgi:hypothetical protein
LACPPPRPARQALVAPLCFAAAHAARRRPAPDQRRPAPHGAPQSPAALSSSFINEIKKYHAGYNRNLLSLSPTFASANLAPRTYLGMSSPKQRVIEMAGPARSGLHSWLR